MHFYSCARRQESADWSNKAKTEFRKLVHAIYSAATPGSYQAARRALHTWTEKKAKRDMLRNGLKVSGIHDDFMHSVYLNQAPQQTQIWQRLDTQEML